MPQIPAAVVLRIQAGVLSLAGLAFIWAGSSGTVAFAGAGVVPGLLMAGAIPLVIALVGPLRVVLSGVQIPAELRRMLAVLGGCLLTSGLVLVVAGLVGTPGAISAALLTCGVCALGASWFGLLALTAGLPKTFYINEMLSVVKSAGLFGKRTESVADREFMRWSKGKRDGVAPGLPAPDGEVSTIDGQVVLLSSFFEGEGAFSPLVLNLGSYSCPHHRKRIAQLHTLIDEWQRRGARFLTVYTAEAHPQDGWDLPGQYAQDEEYTGNDADFCFFYAKNIDDRGRMAQLLIDNKKFRWPVVLDNINDTVLSAYNSWPIRLYVIDRGVVVYAGKQGPFGYAPNEVGAVLERLSTTDRP